MGKRNVLGRGLGALIDEAEKVNAPGSSINDVDVSLIEVNPFQPRSNFNEIALEELTVSIKELGLIQPLTLRKLREGKFQIIAGERRFRASIKAGLTKVPAYIREADDEGMLEMALVENIQREDLDAIEIAFSYQRLIEECNLTQESLSTRVGKQRSTIANYLRLLKLPALLQKGIRDKQITMGHARALINISDSDTQVMIFDQILKYDFSVRKVEEIVRNLNSEIKTNDNIQKKPIQNPKRFQEIKDNLTSILKSPISVSANNKGKGKIVIPFNSENDLDRILKLLEK